MPAQSTVQGLMPCKAIGFASQIIGSIGTKLVNQALSIAIRDARPTDSVIACINTTPDPNLVLGRVNITNGAIVFLIENTGAGGSTGGLLNVAFILFNGPVR